MNSGESIRFLCRRARCAARHVVRRVSKFLRLTEQGCLVPDDFIGVTHEKDSVSMQANAKARERAVEYARRSFQKVTPNLFISSSGLTMRPALRVWTRRCPQILSDPTFVLKSCESNFEILSGACGLKRGLTTHELLKGELGCEAHDF